MTYKAEVLASHPDALCVVSNASYGIGSVKTYAVWTAKNGLRLASSLAAPDAWRKAAAKVRRENAPSDAELDALM